MASLSRGVLAGVAAGAAGTTALNAVTYLDMLTRARPSSTTPEQTVDSLAQMVHLPIPGAGDARANRVSALGALLGLLAGTGTGALLGLAYGWAGRRREPFGLLAAFAGGLFAGNAPMTALGVTDPRSWSGADWLSDVLPHLAYAGATAAVLDALLPVG